MLPLAQLAKDLGYKVGELRGELSQIGIHTIRMAIVGGYAESLTDDDAEAVYSLIKHRPRSAPKDRTIGFFYCIQLQPDLAPTHYKFGFSSNPATRFAAHRTMCPNLVLVKSWPSRRRWERTAMDAITAGLVALGPEQYVVPDQQAMLGLADAFFRFMPVVDVI